MFGNLAQHIAETVAENGGTLPTSIDCSNMPPKSERVDLGRSKHNDRAAAIATWEGAREEEGSWRQYHVICMVYWGLKLAGVVALVAAGWLLVTSL